MLCVLIRIASMSTHSIPFFNIKEENHPKFSLLCSHGIFPRDSNNEFKTAVVNEPSVFEASKCQCSRLSLIDFELHIKESDTMIYSARCSSVGTGTHIQFFSIL